MPSYKKYDFKALEKKWSKTWKEKRIYEPDLERAKKPFYNLMMFPYPSAEGLHVGNVFTFTGIDVYGRMKRMQGHDVFQPIGLDGFGIHSENYALKVGRHPKTQAALSEKNFYKQLESIGNGFAWEEKLETYDPEYYRWTQWIFRELFKRGLAYRKKQEVNWCPSCKTVLADEQVEGGKCERCGSLVVRKELEQWFFKITDYAPELLKDLETLDWPERIKIAQRNWIGRSEGALLDFPLNKNTNYVFLHGYLASPQKNFWPWLKKKMEAQGFKVEAPLLPKSNSLEVDLKVEAVLKKCHFNKDTVIVAHSLGSIVALKLLSKLKTPIAKVVLVSPPSLFSERIKILKRESLWGKIDIAAVRKKSRQFVVIEDRGDKVVPPVEQREMAEKLKAKLVSTVSATTHFMGKEAPEVLKEAAATLSVYTTRPDTLFGATYLVVAPEHPLIDEYAADIRNIDEVKSYVKKARALSDIERGAEGREKTGVELKGLKVKHPGTGELLPIWAADYVLSGYGTGAIMAVPAHDERDFAFAEKYRLVRRQVIEPLYVQKTEPGVYREGEPVVPRDGIIAIVKHWSEDKYICLKWNTVAWKTFVTGGIEKNQTAKEAAIMEIREETGYLHPRFIRELGMVHGLFYHVPKKENRLVHGHILYFELQDGKQEGVSEDEQAIHDITWLTRKELSTSLTPETHLYSLALLENKFETYTGDGVLMNSGKFDGLSSAEAKKKIVAFVGGEMQTRYRLRDWLISRQRYWGPPIPMIFCEACAREGKGERKEMLGWYTVPESQLPVKLPMVKDFRPRGKDTSPLATVPSFFKVSCPGCKRSARRETDVSDTFLDSAWYYLRYLDPKNKKAIFSQKRIKKWLPMASYIGGAEHAVLHLLYIRFLAKFFHDLGLVSFNEPAPRFRANGLIVRDGAKMSKSKGNVVNPDSFIKEFGADAFRMHLMFIGPFEEGGDFQDAGILGVERFLKEVWDYYQARAEYIKSHGAVWKKQKEEYEKLHRALHQAIKKITEDIERLKHNTAIAELMSFRNVLNVTAVKNQESGSLVLNEEDAESFLKILAPFAPFLSEEIWREVLGKKESIHRAAWPAYNQSVLKEKTFTLIVQVNGKVRASLEAPIDCSEEEAKKIALSSSAIERLLGEATPRRIIFVPNRLINLVL